MVEVVGILDKICCEVVSPYEDYLGCIIAVVNIGLYLDFTKWVIISDSYNNNLDMG